MEGRFARDVKLRQMYLDFMREYENLDHMSPAAPSKTRVHGRLCYLPHHGVLRESSVTTKLRVVFNGSQAIPSGESLNSNLLIGKNLLPALKDILLKWRLHRFVLATNIEKMYRQILIHPADRDLQRVLWRADARNEIQEYKLNTVTYGLACAPFLAIRTPHQLAKDEAHRYPMGAAVLQQQAYVDDILTGAETLHQAQQLQEQLIQICKAGGFPLKKWVANDMSLICNIPEEDRMPLNPREWQPHDSHTMLGLRWHPRCDSFSFAVKLGEAEPITKRSVLSKTAQLFDPLGWLAPVVVRAKILIQSTWLKGKDWDSPLNDEDCKSWRQLYEELHALEQIRIPRWMPGCNSSNAVELHGFADASAAVAYLRSKHQHQGITTILVAVKTKVTPLKQISLPRLELSAATLLAQLLTYLQKALNLQNTTIHVWLDSTVALSWIQGHPTRWKTFVANRVAEIQRLVSDARWHHVRSKDNPADCASRGVSPGKLMSHHLWWRGPPWLSHGEESWPTSADLQSLSENLPEERKTAGLAQQNIAEPELLVRYSSLTRLLRITAWCRRWVSLHRCILSVEEMKAARREWIKLVQAASYKTELAVLTRKESLPKKNSLSKLTPFVDELGVMRVGGRLKHSVLAYDEKHPVILPAHSHCT